MIFQKDEKGYVVQDDVIRDVWRNDIWVHWCGVSLQWKINWYLLSQAWTIELDLPHDMSPDSSSNLNYITFALKFNDDQDRKTVRDICWKPGVKTMVADKGDEGEVKRDVNNQNTSWTYNYIRHSDWFQNEAAGDFDFWLDPVGRYYLFWWGTRTIHHALHCTSGKICPQIIKMVSSL